MSTLNVDAITDSYYILKIESFFRVVYLGTKRWFLWSILMLSTAGILTVYTCLLLVSDASHFLFLEQPHGLLLPVLSYLSGVRVYISCFSFMHKGRLNEIYAI